MILLVQALETNWNESSFYNNCFRHCKLNQILLEVFILMELKTLDEIEDFNKLNPNFVDRDKVKRIQTPQLYLF